MEKKEKQQKKNKIPRLVSLVLALTLITTCLLSSTLAKYVVTVSGNDSARVAQLKFDGKITTYDELGTELGAAKSLSKDATPAAISLFKTAYKSASTGNPTTVDADSSTFGDGNLVAPGTLGSFKYAFNGETEVSLKIALGITEVNDGNIPIVYEYNGKYYFDKTSIYGEDYSDEVSKGQLYFDLSNGGSTGTRTQITSTNYGGTLADLATAAATNITVDVGTTNDIAIATATAAKTVKWYWPFVAETSSDGTDFTNISDDYDTELGTAFVDSGTVATIELTLTATATQID